MPELPKVETVVHQLKNAGIIGQSIEQIEVLWPKSFVGDAQSLVGQKVTSIKRYGKHFLFGLSSGQTLGVHLRMTGCFRFEPTDHVRIQITFANGTELYFSDPRKFGRFILASDEAKITNQLGPDALDMSFDQFQKQLQSSRQLKPLLLDQACLAGLGNIYVDEALWEAKLHPTCKANHLNLGQLRALHGAIQKTLKSGVEHGLKHITNHPDLYGQPEKFRHLYRVYGRADKLCRRCQTPLEKLTIAQRSTIICPACQPT